MIDFDKTILFGTNFVLLNPAERCISMLSGAPRTARIPMRIVFCLCAKGLFEVRRLVYRSKYEGRFNISVLKLVSYEKWRSHEAQNGYN